MLRTCSAVRLMVAVFSATQISSAQNVHFQVPPAVPQSQDLHVGVPRSEAQPPNVPDPPASPDDVQKQQAMAARQQRQAEIKRDTEKMFELVQELKDDLLRTDRGVMSIDVLRKAEQIEKLAHGVKSKMKQSY